MRGVFQNYSNIAVYATRYIEMKYSIRLLCVANNSAYSDNEALCRKKNSFQKNKYKAYQMKQERISLL